MSGKSATFMIQQVMIIFILTNLVKICRHFFDLNDLFKKQV